ncbi:hypothetical protein DES53_101352 [Roseimicrobium gellanilyticum]|uniref:Uncharacterized protein n=1 Tax=Roseimicrobium gellanilyticum TaxID=748857 RepID=A0A366HVN7_9BACT|nr:hypothetical protein [Roseimicrobium gellanilyticum]RBP47555.1 hypothetical protein DES53_101352 [Roseimicrobium gellanilyticum]
MDSNREYPPHQSRLGSIQPPAAEAAKLGRLEAGHAHYHALPPPVQERLLKRLDANRSGQFAIDTSLSGSRVVLCFIALLPMVYVVGYGFNARWKGSTEFWLGVVTLVAALIQIGIVLSTWKLFTSKLKDWLVITPLYIIKTEGNEVSFWPLWTLTKLKGTAEYVNGFYSMTNLKMEFGSGPHCSDIDFKSKHGYERIVDKLNDFEAKIRQAIHTSDWNYLSQQDDFREYNAAEAPILKKGSSLGKWITAAFVLGLYITAYVMAWQANAALPLK